MDTTLARKHQDAQITYEFTPWSHDCTEESFFSACRKGEVIHISECVQHFENNEGVLYSALLILLQKKSVQAQSMYRHLDLYMRQKLYDFVQQNYPELLHNFIDNFLQ